MRKIVPQKSPVKPSMEWFRGESEVETFVLSVLSSKHRGSRFRCSLKHWEFRCRFSPKKASMKIKNPEDHQHNQQHIGPKPQQAHIESLRPDHVANRPTSHSADTIDHVDDERVHLAMFQKTPFFLRM